MGFWSGYVLGVLTCCALSAITFVVWLWSEARDTFCMTCHKYINIHTHDLDCPHGRRPVKR